MKLYGENPGEANNHDPWAKDIDGAKEGFPIQPDEAKIIHHDERQVHLARASLLDLHSTGRHVKKTHEQDTPFSGNPVSKENQPTPRHRAES